MGSPIFVDGIGRDVSGFGLTENPEMIREIGEPIPEPRVSVEYVEVPA